MAATALAQEKVWIEKSIYDKAECQYFERLAKVASNSIGQLDSYVCKSLISTETAQEIATNVPPTTKSSSKISKEKKNKADKKNKNSIELVERQAVNKKEQVISQGSRESTCTNVPASGSLANEVAKARQHIKKGLQCVNNIADASNESSQGLEARVSYLEKVNAELVATVSSLGQTVGDLKSVIVALNAKVNGSSEVPSYGWAPEIAVCPAKPSAPKASAPADEDDDIDLFGSDSEGEDAEAAKIREERLAAYAAKKSKKPALIAKSNIIFDVKPWDDETDMKEMEAEVRKITCDGLLWGAAKLVPLAYGIQKLQISCVLEDDKVSVDWLTEEIVKIDELVQSVDIAAFNKV